MLNFLRDFCLIPELTTSRFSHSVFANLLQTNGANLLSSSSQKFTNNVTLGLPFEVFLEFVAIVADNVNWNRTASSRDLYSIVNGSGRRRRNGDKENDTNADTKSKIVAFLQWMDTSNGKNKISRSRGSKMIGKFNLDALMGASLRQLTE